MLIPRRPWWASSLNAKCSAAILRRLQGLRRPADQQPDGVEAHLQQPRAGCAVVRATGAMAETVGVEFFCYHSDRPGSASLRDELLERHWSYMDGYQAQMIARGPTLTADGEVATGSVHILSLPDPVAARAFAFDEPNYQAGVYRDVLLRRWRNLLGRTMWEFPGGRDGGNRYLVLGLGEGPATDLAVPPGRDDLIAYGPLLSDDAATWLGTAVLIRAPDPDTARAILIPDRYASIEVHDWQFGGRPSLSADVSLQQPAAPLKIVSPAGRTRPS